MLCLYSDVFYEKIGAAWATWQTRLFLSLAMPALGWIIWPDWAPTSMSAPSVWAPMALDALGLVLLLDTVRRFWSTNQ